MRRGGRPDGVVTTTLNYLHLPPGEMPPAEEPHPFRAVLISEEEATEEWRRTVSEWLVRSGCLYFSAWGVDCAHWHDDVDFALLDAFDFGEIPDDDFIMTTWHENEPLAEVLWFAGFCAFHPTVELPHTLIVDVSSTERRSEILEAYRQAQDSDPLED
jgi:hypothetical protein